MSPGANGIPVIDGTYAANRKSIEENHDGAAVDESHRLSESRADVPPRFHHDWSDRTAAAAIRKYPKKYESPSDDSDASERIPHRHRHRRKQLRPTMATSPQSDQTKNFPLINGLTSLPATIDFSNLYENSHFDQVFYPFFYPIWLSRRLEGVLIMMHTHRAQLINKTDINFLAAISIKCVQWISANKNECEKKNHRSDEREHLLWHTFPSLRTLFFTLEFSLNEAPRHSPFVRRSFHAHTHTVTISSKKRR